MQSYSDRVWAILCKKAKVLQLANQPVAASEVLKEARAIAIHRITSVKILRLIK